MLMYIVWGLANMFSLDRIASAANKIYSSDHLQVPQPAGTTVVTW